MFAISKGLLAAAAGVLVGGFAPADAAGANRAGPAQQPTSITGCLAQGTAKDSYTLRSADGKTYTLTSTKVNLGEHVGHKVTITGTPAGMETGALKDTGAAPAAPPKGGEAMPSGALNVTTLKHLSSTCK